MKMLIILATMALSQMELPKNIKTMLDNQTALENYGCVASETHGFTKTQTSMLILSIIEYKLTQQLRVSATYLFSG